MTNTPILDIVEIAETQTDRYLTINAAIGTLEGAMSGFHEDVATSSDVVLTDAQFFGNFVFKITGTRSTGFNIDCPIATGTGAVDTERFFAVYNTSTQTATVRAESTPGATVTVLTGEFIIMYQDTLDIWQVASPSAAATIPYDVAVYFPSTPITVEVLAQFEFARACTIPDDFSGSQGYTGTNPTATFVIDIQKNGTDFGDVSFTTGGVPTFTTDAGAVSFAAGDRISFVGPTTVDATVASIALTIASTVD